MTLLFPVLLNASGCLVLDAGGFTSGTGLALTDGGGGNNTHGPKTSGTGSDTTGTVTGSTGGSSTAMARLRVDSNRDGQIDLAGTSDLANKLKITRDKGALFLPNIDDDAQRCKAAANKTAGACFDASDEVVNGPEDAKDLAPIKSVPMKVSDAAQGRVTLSTGPADKVRIFVQTEPGSYHVLKSDEVFSAQQLREGLNLAIEGKDIVRDLKVWDGIVKVKLEVKDGAYETSDEVALRVAPILTHSHQDAVERVVASPVGHPLFNAFRRDLEAAVTKSKLAEPLLYLKNDGEDQWAQDYFEPFYASVPGPEGPRTLRVLLCSHQDRKKAHDALYELVGPDVGVTAIAERKETSDEGIGKGGSTYDSFGNLETIPPHAGYPAGRQIIGEAPDVKGGPSASTMALLRAQGVQDPILLDTGWLSVGHVDEFVSFVPHPQAKLGFKVLVADPVGTFELLKKAVADGHGKALVLSYQPQTKAEKEVFNEGKNSSPTIEAFVNNKKKQEIQAYAEKKIAENLKILRDKIGFSDADIVRVPSLYDDDELGDARAPRTSEGEFGARKLRTLGSRAVADQYLAAYPKSQWAEAIAQRQVRLNDGTERSTYDGFLPAAVNMVVLPKKKSIFLAKQFGPVVNGVDIVQAQLTKVIEGLGYTPHYIDDYLSYHKGNGDVHCGTNTLRVPVTQWWTK